MADDEELNQGQQVSKRTAQETLEYFTQPYDGTMLVGVLPSQAQINEAKKKIKAGGNKREIIGALTVKALEAERKLFGED